MKNKSCKTCNNTGWIKKQSKTRLDTYVLIKCSCNK